MSAQTTISNRDLDFLVGSRVEIKDGTQKIFGELLSYELTTDDLTLSLTTASVLDIDDERPRPYHGVTHLTYPLREVQTTWFTPQPWLRIRLLDNAYRITIDLRHGVPISRTVD